MSAKRQQLSIEIQALEQRSALLHASVSRRIDAIDGQLRENMSPWVMVALGAGAGFLVERLTRVAGARSVGKLGGVALSLLSTLGSMGFAAAAEESADAAEDAHADAHASARAAQETQRQPADAPF